MNTLQPHVVTSNNGQRYVHRRRPPDLFERLFGAALVGAFLVSALLIIALGAGAVWLIVVVVQDLARRLGA